MAAAGRRRRLPQVPIYPSLGLYLSLSRPYLQLAEGVDYHRCRSRPLPVQAAHLLPLYSRSPAPLLPISSPCPAPPSLTHLAPHVPATNSLIDLSALFRVWNPARGEYTNFSQDHCAKVYAPPTRTLTRPDPTPPGASPAPLPHTRSTMLIPLYLWPRLPIGVDELRRAPSAHHRAPHPRLSLSHSIHGAHWLHLFCQ